LAPRVLPEPTKKRPRIAGAGLRLNEHIEADGPTVFAHACKMSLEGIVSKRKDSMCRSGRSPDWLKMKNSNAPAAKREAGPIYLCAPLRTPQQLALP
jgi:ATP-dependent DNA ligase